MHELLERTLPAVRSRVIGRERELADIGGRLTAGHSRLLTLTGMGGIGKTTLAVEAARALAQAKLMDAVFVDLTPARDPGDIALRICDTLGLVQQGRSPVAMLVEYLVPRQMLLVLDNCEHVVSSLAPLIDRILDRCPDVRVLATSRVPLRVRGEVVVPIPPMPLPALDAATPGWLDGNPAVELFVERATGVDPSFVLDAASAGAVAAICRYVEGVPLAVELVAAHAAALTPHEIQARLGQVPSESVGPDLGLARQMSATLDWSHDLLSASAQALFRRLSVFAGSWTVEAAEAVGTLGADAKGTANALVELVDHSLVVRSAHGQTSRYRLLTPVAAYAAWRLDDPVDRSAAALAHATYYLDLVSRPAAAFPMSEPEQLDLVASEYENCEAAMRFAEEAELVPVVTGFALSLLTYWGVRGLLHTAVRRLAAALAVIGPESGYGRGAILGGLAAYWRLLGRPGKATGFAKESAAVFEAIGDAPGWATAVGLLGEIATDLDDFDAAYAHYAHARVILGDGPDPVLAAVGYGNVGGIALRVGDLGRAREELGRAQDILGDRPTWYRVQLLARLGRLARLEGDLDGAAGLLVGALEDARRYGARIDGIACLEELARLDFDRGAAERSVTLLAAATGVRDATGLGATPYDRRLLAADVERGRVALSADEFHDAWRRGLDLGMDQAIEFAVSGARQPTHERSSPRGSRLTPRELQIADLVALGLTNRAIAARLDIAPGTARIHVERILGKLGLTSRVQVATWVVRRHERG